MACRGSRARILFLMWCIAGSSGIYAQNAYLWDGLYAGVNAGGAHGSTCNQWAPAGTDIDSTTHSALTSENCLNSNFLGGLQFGDSFQSGRFALGLGADFDIWHAAETSSTVVYSGAAIPRGTYTFSNRLNPARFAILGPRVGYAGNQWMPCARCLTRGSFSGWGFLLVQFLGLKHKIRGA